MKTKLNTFIIDGKRVKTWMRKSEFLNARQISESFIEPKKEQFKMSGNTDVIANIRTSLHLFPSFARKEMSEDGQSYLSNCCYKTEDCGCKIVGNGTIPNPLQISYCSKHSEK